jgi:hypothetical protein
MEDGWPSSVGLRGQALNHPVLRWLKTVVMSVREKARHDLVRWGPGRRARKCSTGVTRLGVAVEASKSWDGIETGGPSLPLGMSLAGARVLARWCPAQRRREPGLRLLHGT